MNLIEHYIGGKIVTGSSSRKGKVFNPATGSQESEVLLASKSDLDLAVQKAKQSFESWSNTPPLQRARIFFKYKGCADGSGAKVSGKKNFMFLFKNGGYDCSDP